MTTLREAAKQALEMLDRQQSTVNRDEADWYAAEYDEAITALQQALEAEQQDEPVAYRHLHEDGWEYYDAPTGSDCAGCQPLYTRPQPKQQPLTEEEIKSIAYSVDRKSGSIVDFARAIERAHGIGGAA